MPKRIYVDIWGGLGDVVLATPVFERLKSKSPRSRIIALSNSKDRLEVLRHNPYIDKLTSFSYYHRLLKFLGIISIQDIRYGFLKPSLSYSKKASEIIAGMLGVTIFGLFLTPSFYLILRWISGRKLKQPGHDEE